MAATSSPSTVDLSRFDPPTIVEQLDYETIFQRKVARVRALMPFFDATVDSDPAVKVLQVATYDEILLRADFNERLQQRLVAYPARIGAAMSARALVRQADLARVFRAAAKVGIPVRVEIEPGRIIVTTGAGVVPAGANSLDEMFA